MYVPTAGSEVAIDSSWPTPRRKNEVALPRPTLLLPTRFGTCEIRSSVLMICRRSRSSSPSAVTEIGTSCSDSSVLCAETTISSSTRPVLDACCASAVESDMAPTTPSASQTAYGRFFIVVPLPVTAHVYTPGDLRSSPCLDGSQVWTTEMKADCAFRAIGRRGAAAGVAFTEGGGCATVLFAIDDPGQVACEVGAGFLPSGLCCDADFRIPLPRLWTPVRRTAKNWRRAFGHLP